MTPEQDKNTGYRKLIMAVLGIDEDDILPLRESDIQMIERMLGEMTSKRIKAIRLRFGISGEVPHTLKAAGEKMGVTGPAVRVHEAQALRRMKHPARTKQLMRLSRSLLEEQLSKQTVQIGELTEELARKTSLISNIQDQIQMEVKAPAMIPVRSAIVLSKEINELDISVRAYNCLKNAGIKTVGELVQKTEVELLRSKNFGRKALNELKGILAGFGLNFGTRLG